MKMENFIGIDVSKQVLDICLVRESQIVDQFQAANNVQAVRTAFTRLKKLGVNPKNSCCCMEHTGIYNLPALEFLWSKGYSIWLERAIQIKQCSGAVRGKSDKIDALRIAQYAYKNQSDCKLWQPEREQIRRLKILLVTRRRFINAKKQLSMPIKEAKGFMDKSDVKLSEKLSSNFLKAAEASILKVEREIQELLKGDPQLKHLFTLITSVQGIGCVTAAHVIATTNEFKTYSEARKYACYSGIVPFPHSSGTSIRGRTRVSHMANKSMKTLMHMSAMAAINMKGELREYYMKKVQEGKNKMSVINAIRNKLVLRIFAVVKRNEPYQNNYENTFA
jgi:transposase